MKNSSNYFAKSISWSIISNLSNALIKFITLPLLLTYFGRDDFGLITIAVSVNAYLQLLDMGVNTGAINFFSKWIANNENKLLDSVARTSITFYTIIGAINSIALLIVAFYGLHFFKIDPNHEHELFYLFIILAIFSIFNWAGSVFNQLLIADSKFSYVQKIKLLSTVLSLIVTFYVIYFRCSLQVYFFLFTVSNSIVIIPLAIVSKKNKLISNFKLGTDWKNFNIILKYSSAILLMAIFQMSAVKLRPIVLVMFSNNGAGVVADFRILETITAFIISMGSMSTSIFLPKTSSLIQNCDVEKINEFAYVGTRYTSIFTCLICFPFILCGKEILSLYVGIEYEHLYYWLVLWVITIVLFLHNGPAASLVLATRKTRMLVFSSAIACVISIVVNSYLAPYFSVGSAVIGYAIYVVIQMMFYYFYFNNRILKLNSFKVFKAFLYPTFLASVIYFAVNIFEFNFQNLYLVVIFKLGLWFI
ncbi:lipopolysaccharide biosynthesis protein, partial [Sphingobacterium rhinopitheci]|uniref:lipopolysaccharide biosynthesis protein n=1 Tax=Sphingobacterium rhinopitheci TaxID=2781960 RepID=UPI001F5170C3